MKKEKRALEYFKELQYCNGCFRNSPSHEECYKRHCSFCDTFFDSKELLRRHALKYHSSYWCETCGQSFKYFSAHVKNYHV